MSRVQPLGLFGKNEANRVFQSQIRYRRIVRDVFFYWRSIVTVVTPLLLLPLAFSTDPKYRCIYCVALMAVYWTCEVMPLAVTALLPIILFPIMRIMDAKSVSKEYLNDTNFLFIGGLIIAVAVERCSLHERIALRVATVVGSKPRWMMFGFMLVTAFLSMFISNTATTAMMVPIVDSVIRQLLLSFRSQQHCNKNYVNEFHRLSSVREIVPTTASETSLAKGLIISICYSANIGGTATITGTPPNLVMMGQLSTLFPDAETGVNYLSWILFAFPLMLTCLIICWLLLLVLFLRKAPKGDENVANLLLHRYQELPKMSFAEKTVLICFLILVFLWVARDPNVVPGFGKFFPKGYFTDATSAILVSVLLFMLPDEVPDFIWSSSRDRDGNPSRRGSLMDWKTVQKHFPWSVVLLLGGGFAMAAGLKQTGLSSVLGRYLSSLKELPLPLTHIVFIVAAMLLTNFCSNTVTASIFLPVVSTIAQESEVNPLATMLPVTLACSMAFMLPAGTPPNAIAFSSGLLKVADMVLCGTLMSILTALIMIIYMAGPAKLVFPLDEFPEWAIPVDVNSTLIS